MSKFSALEWGLLTARLLPHPLTHLIVILTALLKSVNVRNFRAQEHRQATSENFSPLRDYN